MGIAVPAGTRPAGFIENTSAAAARSGSNARRARLLDHPVRAQQDRLRDRDTGRLGGLHLFVIDRPVVTKLQGQSGLMSFIP